MLEETGSPDSGGPSAGGPSAGGPPTPPVPPGALGTTGAGGTGPTPPTVRPLRETKRRTEVVLCFVWKEPTPSDQPAESGKPGGPSLTTGPGSMKPPGR